MSLYKCPKCGNYFQHSKKADEEIEECINKGISSVVIVCECGDKMISGGEVETDPYSEELCIMMFGGDYNDHLHSDLNHYDAVMLKEVPKGEDVISTWSNSKNQLIHLAPK